MGNATSYKSTKSFGSVMFCVLLIINFLSLTSCEEQTAVGLTSILGNPTLFLLATDSVLNLPIIEEYQERREQQGITVIRVSVDDLWQQDNSEIFDRLEKASRIRDYFITQTNENHKPYALLIGSNDTIPMIPSYVRVNHEPEFLWTDFYYRNLSGTWKADANQTRLEFSSPVQAAHVDLYVGRIPFDKEDEITTVLQNTLAYETRLPLKKALICGGQIAVTNDTSMFLDKVIKEVFQPAGYAYHSLYEDCNSIFCSEKLNEVQWAHYWDQTDWSLALMVSHGSYTATECMSTAMLPSLQNATIVVSTACYGGYPADGCLGIELVRSGAAVGFFGSASVSEAETLQLTMNVQQNLLSSIILAKYPIVRAMDSMFRYYQAYAQNIEQIHRNMLAFNWYGDPMLQIK